MYENCAKGGPVAAETDTTTMYILVLARPQFFPTTLVLITSSSFARPKIGPLLWLLASTLQHEKHV